MKKLIGFVCFLAILLSLYYVAYESSFFTIDDIQIKNDEKITEFDILKYSKIEMGMNILNIDIDYSVSQLVKHPFIKSASIEKTYPNKIKISYEIREPVLNIYHVNTFISIDEELMVVAISGNETGLITIFGVDIENFNLGSKIKAYNEQQLINIVDLVKLIQMSDLNFVPTLSIIDDEIFIIIRENFVANFGDGKNIEKKFNEFYTIYNKLNSENVNSGIIKVNTDGLPIYSPFGK